VWGQWKSARQQGNFAACPTAREVRKGNAAAPKMHRCAKNAPKECGASTYQHATQLIKMAYRQGICCWPAIPYQSNVLHGIKGNAACLAGPQFTARHASFLAWFT